MVRIRKNGSPTNGSRTGLVVALFLVSWAGCSRADHPAEKPRQPTTLTIGFGLTTGEDPQFGIQQATRIIALEGLINLSRDGRPRPSLAESWSTSPDGLTVRLRLRPSVTFQDGGIVDADTVRTVLTGRLPQNLGPAYEDVKQIRTVSEHEIEFSLRQRSSFLLEALDVRIEQPGTPGVGTGPFYRVAQEANGIEMRANESYYLGRPFIDRIVIKPYESVRSAWADLLRGQVDMLYEVGTDALDSLRPSTDVKVFTFRRAYAHMVLLNVRKPSLRDSAFRRALNAAIDRDALVAEVLEGHGSPATGPVWPHHWAYNPDVPGFRYQPRAMSNASRRPRFTCLMTDPSSFERLGLALQRQLQAVGVDLELETMSVDRFVARIQAGDFELILIDVVSGPNLLRPYQFWHSGGPNNYGHFNSPRVDAALDAIRHAPDDAAYKAGAEAFQRAILDDPPAIFLAWSERARAVSRRFDVQAEADRDVLGTLRLWRPVTGEGAAGRN